MLVMRDEAAVSVRDVIGQTASLAAIATVGAPPGMGMADKALAAVGHAQGTVHKELQVAALGIEHVMDGFDLRQRQLSGQPANTAELTALLADWSKPEKRSSVPSAFTFMFTDIVNSTALTSQLGNAGAQRVVRAHNQAVRGSIQAFGGREVKHTGDGIMATFPTPGSEPRDVGGTRPEPLDSQDDTPTHHVHTGRNAVSDEIIEIEAEVLPPDPKS